MSLLAPDDGDDYRDGLLAKIIESCHKFNIAIDIMFQKVKDSFTTQCPYIHILIDSLKKCHDPTA